VKLPLSAGEAPDPQGGTGPILAGLNVLLVEDEPIISFLVEDMLKDLGCSEVWVAGHVSEALELIGRQVPHVAILDVHLRREVAYPIAARLTELDIPFVFASGYGSGNLPLPWKDHRSVQKPFVIEDLAAALSEVIAVPRGGSSSIADKPV
jgi:CheY-like chemotaxis protein